MLLTSLSRRGSKLRRLAVIPKEASPLFFGGGIYEQQPSRRGQRGVKTVTIDEHTMRTLLKDFKASEHFDLVVIGSGPAAQKCAIDAAKRGKKTAVVDKKAMQGGVCVHTGTVPSKTFREAIIHLTGYRHKGFYGSSSQPVRRIGVDDILQRVHKVESVETDIVRDQLLRNGITLITGTGRFLEDPEKRTLAVLENEKIVQETDSVRHITSNICKRILTADKYLIAVGTRPARREDIPFDGERILDSDQLLWNGLKEVPRKLMVVGTGVIGMEYASMMNAIPSCNVTIIDSKPSILEFADAEVTEALAYHMRQMGARFILGEQLKSVKRDGDSVIVELSSGKKIIGDALLYCVGRQANTDSLNLAAVGVEPNPRGIIEVNDNYQTAVPHIYAAGDCIGFPALASTSMEQGRQASVHMWGATPDRVRNLNEPYQSERFRTRLRSGDLFPFGIYTIPEISMVGKPEHVLTKEGIPYEVGVARYEDLARGQMLGGTPGFLKLIFCPHTLKLLGVHAIGEGATEIIHVAQIVMSTGGTIDYFRNAVFNYPTLAEAYRVAALRGLWKVDRVYGNSFKREHGLPPDPIPEPIAVGVTTGGTTIA